MLLFTLGFCLGGALDEDCIEGEVVLAAWMLAVAGEGICEGWEETWVVQSDYDMTLLSKSGAPNNYC